jgi:hypothetical protein
VRLPRTLQDRAGPGRHASAQRMVYIICVHGTFGIGSDYESLLDTDSASITAIRRTLRAEYCVISGEGVSGAA